MIVRRLVLVALLAGGCRVPRPVVPSEDARIQRIEDGLLPAVIPEGKVVTGRPLEERLVHYGVAGASVAVIDVGRVTWARDYGKVPAGPPAAEIARELARSARAVREEGRVYDPSRGQGAVVLAGHPALAGEIMRAIAAEYGWPDYPGPVVKPVAAVDPAIYDDYTGRYRVGGTAILVAREGDRLTMVTPGGPAAELYPDGPDRFFLLENDATVSFERDGAGRVTGLTARIAGREIRAARES